MRPQLFPLVVFRVADGLHACLELSYLREALLSVGLEVGWLFPAGGRLDARPGGVLVLPPSSRASLQWLFKRLGNLTADFLLALNGVLLLVLAAASLLGYV